MSPMYREEMITMGQKELSRWHVLEMAEAGKITLKEAAVSMGVSYRQAKRIRRAVSEGKPSAGPSRKRLSRIGLTNCPFVPH